MRSPLANRKDLIITTSGCLGLCSEEPLVTVEILGQEPIRYHLMDKNKMRQVFRRHVLEGEIQEEFALARGTGAQWLNPTSLSARSRIMRKFRSHVLVCGGTGCHSSGSLAVMKSS